jgi:hypothetical protein
MPLFLADITRMSQVKKSTVKAGRKPARAAVSGGYRVLGTTYDGVKILRPKVKPTHFTLRQIRRAIETVRRSSSD